MTASLLPTASSLARLRARWTRPRRAPRVDAPPAMGPAPALPGGVRVGMAEVLGLDPRGRPVVRLDDGRASEVTAEWALPHRYVPAPGDLLWTVGRGPRLWVIGVAHGRGRSELLFRGDLTLAAGRALRLQADRGLRLVGRVVSLRAGALELVAGALQERLGDAARLVAGLLEEVAGGAVRVTEEQETLLARDVTVMAEESARLDGDLLQIA
jgi:hypothetical protein